MTIPEERLLKIVSKHMDNQVGSWKIADQLSFKFAELKVLDIKKLLTDIYDLAYNDGHSDGYSIGYEDGHRDGEDDCSNCNNVGNLKNGFI